MLPKTQQVCSNTNQEDSRDVALGGITSGTNNSEEVKRVNGGEFLSSITLSIPKLTNLPNNTLVVDDIIENRRRLKIESRGSRASSLIVSPSSKTNLIPILDHQFSKPKSSMTQTKTEITNKVETNKKSNNQRGNSIEIDNHQLKNQSSQTTVVLTPNNPNSIHSNSKNNESEEQPSTILESLPFFTFLKIGMLKENSDPKHLEAYKELSRQNLFFMTSWFRYFGIFFVLVFLTMYISSGSNKSLILYFTLFPVEIFTNLYLNYITCCKSPTSEKKNMIHLIRTVASSSFGVLLQLYYTTLSIYLLVILKLIISCHIFGEHLITSLISSTIFILGATLPLKILGQPIEVQVNNAIVMTSVAFMCLFFSKIYAEEKRYHYKQKFAYIQEKYLSNEKTHMIANISHEARNPLHGILGASTILRHDMEKNSHSDKKKKRGRKNSFLQSPSHSPLQSKNNFLNVSNDDAHYSSDCDSYCGDSTCEQPYLELVNDIYNNANLLLHIFSTSLQMTSLEMGNIKLKNEPFNLLDTIESVISVFYNIAADKNVSLHSYINLNSLPNQVMGDHVRVSQILMNFVSNSIKYSSNDSRDSSVVIRCDICNDEELKSLNVEKDKIFELLDDKDDIIFVKIDCIDNGKGIEKENINNLFKAFHTFDLESTGNMDTSGTVFDQYYLKSISGNTKESNGTSLLLSNRTGVGLNISKQLVERMKGCIMVSSELGIGTTMSVIFPFKKSPLAKPIQSQRVKELRKAIKDFNVYIIDNDSLFLSTLKDYLEHVCSDITVTTFVNPGCIGEIDESKPLVVIYSENVHTEVKQALKLVASEKILIPIGHRGRTRKYSNMKYIIKPLKVDEMISVLIEKLEKQRKKKSDHQLVITPPPEIAIIAEPVSTIEIVLPENNSGSPSLSDSKRILITDDNLINRKVMEKMVRLLGFTQVDCASNGLECFEMYKQKGYSIILLDLLMPVMCGKQSLKHIREFEESEGKKRTPVIAITANIWESPDTLSQLGFDSVIYKPILIEKLKEEIEKLT